MLSNMETSNPTPVETPKKRPSIVWKPRVFTPAETERVGFIIKALEELIEGFSDYHEKKRLCCAESFFLSKNWKCGVVTNSKRIYIRGEINCSTPRKIFKDLQKIPSNTGKWRFTGYIQPKAGKPGRSDRIIMSDDFRNKLAIRVGQLETEKKVAAKKDGKKLTKEQLEVGRSPKCGRVSDPMQNVQKDVRKEVLKGWYDYDLVKANLGLIAELSGEQVLRDLYDNQATVYPQLALDANCSPKLVKLFINCSLGMAAPTVNPYTGWFQDALGEGKTHAEAQKTLVLLSKRLRPELKAIRKYWTEALPRVKKGNLKSHTFNKMMWLVSDIILDVQLIAENMGNITFNMHDGIISDKEITEDIWEAAFVRHGFPNMKYKEVLY